MRKSLLYILAAAMLCMVWACVKDLEKEGVSNTTQYIGTVVEKSTMQPVEGVSVQVTDGSHVHAVSVTDRNGRFKLTDVNFDELGDDCYLWLDGTALDLPSKQEPLMGLGSKVYDYRNIILYDKTNVDLLPRVTTGDVSNIMEHTATVSGSVSSNGGHALTARGICWATHQSPTIDDFHATAGVEIGSFSCNLTNLQGSTTYYYRAYATNSVGTTYGEQRTFTSGNGLPTVTTTNPSMSGNSVVSGGNVTSDGGYPVTARGICYGVYPNPDLTAAYTHTKNGTGTGYFSSVVNTNIVRTLYVRAYATNANGTSYGNQVIVDLDYLALPTFMFNGHTYRVAPDANNCLTWGDADRYCRNLTLYGYTDWRLPTLEELLQMYNDRMSIGDFYSSEYWSSNVLASNSDYHYAVLFGNGSRGTDYNNYRLYVRPIRIEN